MDQDPEAEEHTPERCLDDHIRAEARLIASLAHKINNPLAYTVNYLFVLDRSLHEAASHDLARKIRQGLEKATEVLSVLVDAANVPSARPAPINVTSLVERFISAHVSDPPFLIINTVEKGATVIACEERVLSILGVFLDNARDAGARNAVVTCGERGGRPRIAVSDDGDGVAPGDAGSVFDPCFSTRKDRAGIGLYAAYHAALSFGGHLGYEPNPAGGSIFSIYCPREVARSEG